MSHSNKTLQFLQYAFRKTKLLNVKPTNKFLLSTTRNINFTNYLNANISFNLSDIGEGIREVVVKEWYVKVGDKVAQFDNICEVQSDKASVTITSRYDGVISKLHYKIDDVALVGKPLIDVETADSEESSSPPEQVPEVVVSKPAVVDDVPTISSPICIPSVRRLAKEHDLNLSQVKGTGKHGRILKEDVLHYMKSPQQAVQKSADTRIEPITGFRKAMVKTMTEALKIPHFVYSDEIKITKLSSIRKSLKDRPELSDIKITLMPFFIKAASNALQRYPVINASVDENCENIIYKTQHNIGVAMDTKIGLAVPIIKDVANLTIVQIAEELNRLIKSGKNGTFSPSDLSGGTFTISNIGIIGGTYTKPVIMPPQTAIIAIGASQTVPRFDDLNNVVAEEIVNLSGAADHRIIDGATMANFTKLLKKQVENPNLLFLNL